MKRHYPLLIVALAAFAIIATACSKTETNTNNANATTNSSNTKTANTTPTASAPASGSPTAAMQASFDAAKKKDVAAFKKTIASADLKKLDEVMAKDGKTADDFLKEMMESPNWRMPDTLEMRNEKINGDKATVEQKNVEGEWKTAYFVKEGGEWKRTIGGESEGQDADKKESGGMEGHDMK